MNAGKCRGCGGTGNVRVSTKDGPQTRSCPRCGGKGTAAPHGMVAK